MVKIILLSVKTGLSYLGLFAPKIGKSNRRGLQPRCALISRLISLSVNHEIPKDFKGRWASLHENATTRFASRRFFDRPGSKKIKIAVLVGCPLSLLPVPSSPVLAFNVRSSTSILCCGSFKSNSTSFAPSVHPKSLIKTFLTPRIRFDLLEKQSPANLLFFFTFLVSLLSYSFLLSEILALDQPWKEKSTLFSKYFFLSESGKVNEHSTSVYKSSLYLVCFNTLSVALEPKDGQNCSSFMGTSIYTPSIRSSHTDLLGPLCH